VSQPLPPLRLLHDNADLWSGALSILGDDAPTSAGEGGGEGDLAIGIVTWGSATRDEVSELPGLRERHAGPLVVILAELPSTRGSRAVVARLEGSVLAGDLRRALVPTLQAVAAGQCVVPRSVRRLLDRPPLSPRERQILAMVVLDFSNAEIARRLFVTESNVKSHLTSAFNKIGVSSRSAAAELILDGESGLGPGILRISPE
jgi:DNA-binding NarL/FixJ family response regulator